MEKKETKKTTTKKEVKKEISKVEVVNTIDYTAILNKIFYALIAIVVALLLVFTAIIVKGTGNTTSTGTDEETLEYDVSEFDTLSTTAAITEIQKGDLEIVYIGRSTCGYCAKFLPVLREAQDDYGYKTIYIDLEQMTSDDQTSLLTYDNEEGYIAENFGYTPMVLIFKDSKLVNGWVGYAEYSSFAAFLEDNGLTK